MAKGFLGLAFSSNSIRYAYLEKKAGVILCPKVGFMPLDETALSASLVSETLREILSKEKISPLKIFVVVFTPQTVTYQINLPKMPKTELNEVVAGEIEKAPAFADKEFDYIYRSYVTDLNRLEVIFSAIRQDSLDSIIKGIAAVKIPLESLEIAPLNLLDILPKIPAGVKEEALLVLDERQSYIIISDKKECRFLYMVSTGKIDLYPYGNGEVNKTALLHWVDELDRVFKSYVMEHKREAVRKVWFIWDNTAAFDLSELLDKELKEREVTKLGIENIPGFKKGYEEEFNPIYLLSCPGIIVHIKKTNSMFDFNHFLAGSKLKGALKKIIFVSFCYVILISLLSGKVFLAYHAKYKSLFQQLHKTNAQKARFERDTARLKKERDNFLNMRSRLLKQATFVRMLNRVSWSKIFGEVATELPNELSLTSFKIPESGRVKIKGNAFKIESVAKLMRKVHKSSVLENAKFDFLRETKIEGKNIFSFGIIADLKRDSNEEK